jgi:hypothetical protein
VRFVLAGQDSLAPPDDSPSYKAYLQKRIPERHRHRFQFPGHVQRHELEAMLPKVLFGVFPNTFESFGYAVHELYAAGIPLILNDLPAYKACFRHEEHVLIFDGSTMELAASMQRLLGDPALRERLGRPQPVLPEPLGSYYDAPPQESWMEADSKEEIELTVCVLDEQGSYAKLKRTLDSLPEKSVQVFVLSRTSSGHTQKVRFLGEHYSVHSKEGMDLHLSQLRVKDALLILHSGDVLNPRFIPAAVETLKSHPSISVVGGWRSRLTPAGRELVLYPVDAMPESLPFLEGFIPTRMVVRMPRGRMFHDLFEPRLNQLGEVEHIWMNLRSIGPGTVIPEPVFHIDESTGVQPGGKVLSNLILGSHGLGPGSSWRLYLFSRILA